MENCLNCGIELAESKGPRKRKFCSAACRQKKWQKDSVELRKQAKNAPTIDLPKDYTRFIKVGILKKDGTVGSIKPAIQDEDGQTLRTPDNWATMPKFERMKWMKNNK